MLRTVLWGPRGETPRGYPATKVCRRTPRNRHFADHAVVWPTTPPISVFIDDDVFNGKTNDGQHRVGLALLDLDEPGRVIKRCEEWVLGPTESYEQVGDVPGVVFPSGLIHRASGELRLYYGAADTCIGMAAGRLDEVLAYVMKRG